MVAIFACKIAQLHFSESHFNYAPQSHIHATPFAACIDHASACLDTLSAFYFWWVTGELSILCQQRAAADARQIWLLPECQLFFVQFGLNSAKPHAWFKTNPGYLANQPRTPAEHQFQHHRHGLLLASDLPQEMVVLKVQVVG